jgi:predicted regulator of Ras-like GTPase activity (Roadblock/LC7/MglB family)
MTTNLSPLARQAEYAARKLFEAAEGARAVVVASADGFALGHASRDATDPGRLAALICSLGALGETACRETGIGTPRCLLIECTSGRLVVRNLVLDGIPLAIAVLCDASATVGLVWSVLGRAERFFEPA